MSTNRMATLEPDCPASSNGRPAPSLNGKNGVGTPAAPSANRGNGVDAAPAAAHNPDVQPKPGRDANGRFAKGNAGGPGNPFARNVAALRQLAFEAVPADKIRAIFSKLADLALEGNVPAAKLVLAYTVGKPAPAPDPDRLDLEEWQHFKETAPMMGEVGEMFTPAPIVPLACARAARFAKTKTQSDLIVQLMTAPDGGRAQMDEMLKARAAAKNELPAEEFDEAPPQDAPPPSANGDEGTRPEPSTPDEAAPADGSEPTVDVDAAEGKGYSSHEVEAARRELEAFLAKSSPSAAT